MASQVLGQSQNPVTRQTDRRMVRILNSNLNKKDKFTCDVSARGVGESAGVCPKFVG